MTRYNIRYKFSRNGTSWSLSSTFVVAESESDAIRQVESMYPHVTDIKVLAQRPV